MLKVKTKIGQSGIHGMGLFADELIKEGTVTWEYDPKWDRGFTQAEVDALPEFAKEFCMFYSYFDYQRNMYILPMDHLRFINHTEDTAKQNITSTPDKDIAARDIQPGEELLCDYFKFDPNYFERHGLSKDQLS